MTFKSPTPPLCRNCSRAVKKYTTTVYVRDPLTKGAYDDSTQYETIRTVKAAEPLKSKEDCQRHSNKQVLALDYTVDYVDGEPDKSTRRVHHFSEWDGETYDDQFFCSGTCAQQFGYRMAARVNTRWLKRGWR